MGSYVVIAEPLIARTARMRNRSRTSNILQKPTRLPYSCHAQLGISGSGDPPAGGGRTVRGMVSRGFHSSTLIMTQTTSRPLAGNARRGRSLMAEYSRRSIGNIGVLLKLE